MKLVFLNFKISQFSLARTCPQNTLLHPFKTASVTSCIGWLVSDPVAHFCHVKGSVSKETLVIGEVTYKSLL